MSSSYWLISFLVLSPHAKPPGLMYIPSKETSSFATIFPIGWYDLSVRIPRDVLGWDGSSLVRLADWNVKGKVINYSANYFWIFLGSSCLRRCCLLNFRGTLRKKPTFVVFYSTSNATRKKSDILWTTPYVEQMGHQKSRFALLCALIWNRIWSSGKVNSGGKKV